MCPDVEFTYQDKFPQVLGEFVWTGFDYLGEPTPFWSWRDKDTNDWPSRSSYFGIRSTWPDSPRIATISTRASGPPSPWCTCCRIGIGKARKVRRFP